MIDQRERPGRTIKSIQCLRGLAAFAVVFLHASSTAENHNIIAPGLNGLRVGGWGVDLFFVISGFIMITITDDAVHGWRKSSRFWMKRFLRLAPLYWLVTIMVVAISILLPGATEYKPSMGHIFFSFLFIPSTDLRGIVAPPLGVGWSINYEVYFYLCFGFILLFRRGYQLPLLLTWAVIMPAIGLITKPVIPYLAMATDARLWEFAAGACVAFAFSRKFIPSPNFCRLLLVTGFILIIGFNVLAHDVNPVLTLGIPSVMIVAGAAGLECSQDDVFNWPLFIGLGDCSYSLYLSHIVVLAAFGKAVAYSGLPIYVSGYLLFLIEMGAAVLCGWLLFSWIERPLHQWSSSMTRTSGDAI